MNAGGHVAVRRRDRSAHFWLAGRCCEGFRRDLAAPVPASVGSMAIYTRTDGIVDWRACIDPAGASLEVVGTTHCGMVSHAPTLHAVALALAGYQELRAASPCDEPGGLPPRPSEKGRAP